MLQAHVEALYSQVRSKALIQYVTPFTSVNLATMATAFATTVGWVPPAMNRQHKPSQNSMPADMYPEQQVLPLVLHLRPAFW